MEVKDEVELTHAVKVLVQHLHEMVHRLEDGQLVVFFVHETDEVQTGILLVNDLEFLPVQEVAQLRAPGQHDVIDLFQESLSLLCRVHMRVPFG